MGNINFGIDLGTTNSGISKFADGKVHIYKNPVGFSDTLPSIVAYKKGRILIGDKARELLKSAHLDVFSSFKRKMGTEHLYDVKDTDEQKSPVELSAMILKELQSFIPDEKPQSIVITIPASFDTVQSNATKKAGLLAGFQQVVLLQEPIAACLAYANFQTQDQSSEKNWLVYDFGGGTFDVALVKINERELKITDHEGNNFLGGVDLDHLVIEHLFVPKIEKVLHEESLFKKMMSKENGFYAKLYYELLYKAEEIKKELSVKEIVNTEVELNDGDHYIDFTISRNDFNQVIAPKVDETITLIKKLLEENQKSASDIERIILVGGTTYIPYIREHLKEIFQITVDNSIDPTTAVMVGAAYFAGTKEEDLIKTENISVENTKDQDSNAIGLKLIYDVNTQDDEELMVGNIAGDFEGYYRITRKDGGFDTGLMSFKNKFSEFVKILPKQVNLFNLTVSDQNQNVVFEQNNISINHGIYNISGQPLPNDICLEVDDNFGSTYLERIFKKNDILPLTKTIYKTTSKNFNKEADDKLIINILEGKTATLPASNMSIGYIEINSKDLPINLLKGMDIELKFSMSESRDLSVSVYISSVDFEKKEIFNPHTKHINKDKFQEDIDKVIDEIETELSYVNNVDEADPEDISVLVKFKNIKDELFRIKFDLIEVQEDEQTERIFQLDERKRRALQEYDKIVRFRDVIYEIDEYKISKADMESLLEEATQRQKEQFKKIIKDEKIFLESNEKSLIKRKTKELDKLHADIYYQKDESYASLYYYYKYRDIDEYKDEKRASKLFENGDKAMENNNFKEVKYVIQGLYDLLKVKPKNPFEDTDGNLGLK
ncbi:Hsp70 family protein [Chryseobacterium chendengshani]|uniref:Hsp70 family protein n=1 Tax=Chryseobacterium sp. LJ668 TaxID=2864040 RepID=UPI001C68A633|nr:Hsp70 family protein [Chryseobacterium sp. LJ668]MBW8522971.1 Hsp70 family protein [Chryseobacterium sp. LJ668]QYK16500.1 Hsp70 family protein [Chryseobacterium sp. LJ668]